MSLACHPLRLPLSQPYTWSKGSHDSRETVLVADHGGWGEVAMPPHEPMADVAEIAKWRLDAEAAPERIRAGLMGARLDGEAREQGTSLAELLAARSGLTVRRVECNALIPVLPTRETTQAARDAVEAGYRTIKVKSDGNRKHDVNRLRSLRNALPDVRLRWDPNGAYSPIWAADHLNDLAQFELEYVEDPVKGRAIERLIGRSPVPIAIDEGATDIDAIAESEARDVIVKPQRVGGPDAAAQVVQWCRDNDRHVTITNSLESAVGRAHALAVAALTQSAAGLATDTFLGLDVAELPSQPIMEAKGPGIGIDPVIPDEARWTPPVKDEADEDDAAAKAADAPPAKRMFSRRK
ncbi:MAG: mandelate racemase/muconate lactonizing enzyme family protein [Thermoplasmatota archaeon]